LELASEVDFGRIEQSLRRRRLLTTLGPRICRLAGRHLPGGFAENVETALDDGRRQAGLLCLADEAARTRLRGAGITAVPLKGSTLAERLYGDPGRRLASDVDVLVAPSELHRAARVLEGLGYLPPNDPLDARGMPRLHLAMAHAAGTLPAVEIHWRVHWYEERFACERLLPPAGERSECWRAEDRDELAALLLFYARDGLMNLRIAADLGAWWDRYGENIRAPALDQVCVLYPALADALGAAALAAERVVGLPATTVLSGHRPPRRARVAARLANPLPYGRPSQLHAETALVDGLLAPPGARRAFIRRQVLVRRAELEAAAGGGPSRSPVGHATRVLVRMAFGARRLPGTGVMRGRWPGD
jgi:hypothetical protein